MSKILVIEDDATMLRGLRDNLEYEGYEVVYAADGEKGLELALDVKPDLILLDIMLPKVNGYEICRLLRKEKLDVPIIMLTAKGQESDIILGLNTGADDYVTKPFSIKQLLARVAAFLRRRQSQDGKTFTFGDCQLDMGGRVLRRGGEEVWLTPKEYELLALFVRKAGKALTRNEILNTVWGYDNFVTSRTIDRFVTTLRGKIEQDAKNPKFIHTIREIGYRFNIDQ